VRVYEILEPTRSNLLLQVYDELIFELHKDEEADLREPCINAMLNASEFPMELDVQVWDGSWSKMREEVPF